MSLDTLTQYNLNLSFTDLCKYFLNKAFDEISKKYQGTFVIGYHIRHFMDSEAPTYLARPSDNTKQAEVDKSIADNKKKGKHTINHIIDNLYYKEATNKNTLITLQISYNEVFQFQKLEGISDFDCINGLAHIEKKELSKYKLASNIEELVKELNLDTNYENINSIVNAIEQIESYLPYGNRIQCLILRPKNQFGYVVGVSLISQEAFDIKTIFEMLKADFELLNTNTDKNELIKNTKTDNDDSIIKKIIEYKAFNIDYLKNRLPDNFYTKIIGIEPNLEHFSTQAKKQLKKTIESFINLITHFCDEKVEGHPLTYGFVLGNPGLLNFLENNDIFPSILANSESSFTNIDDIKSNIHLFANHEVSSIVIPYLHDFTAVAEKNPIPSFILPMKSFAEDIFNWDEGLLIHNSYRPYAFLSYRFPWLISAVIGPYSQIRLFKGGNIIAFKDGKGWKSGFPKSEDNLSDLQVNFNDSEKIKIEKLINLAKLFSPIYNPNSHGGFIIYAGDIDTFTEDDKKEFKSSFEPLIDKTLMPIREDTKWLINENIFTTDSSGKTIIDKDVCYKLLQTCVLDGAITLTGSEFNVKSFGNRLSFKPNSTKVGEIREDANENVSGTKRKTAMEFVKWCSTKNMTKYFAIAISADGPIRIYYDTKTCDGKLKLKTTTIFELFEKEEN